MSTYRPGACLRMISSVSLLLFASVSSFADTMWSGPESLKVPITQESKPYTRWWWLGSAVDEEGLRYNLEEMAKMAENLIAVTNLQRHISSSEESVGGPIEVAIITKTGGFKWIKHNILN